MKRLLSTLFIILACLPSCTESCAEQPTRPKVALVIGGGGAKGAAAVGALKYVEASGVPIDMVVGTSIGAIVGGLYSVGYRSEQLDSMFRAQDWVSMGLGSLLGDSIVRTLRNMTNDSMADPQMADSDRSMSDRRMTDYSNIRFDDLPVPFRCVAVDVKHQREVVLKEGDLAQAMRASMAIPLVFKPVKMGGMLLVDGGVLNNLPVDVAKDMGADIVIAIDLTVNQHEGKNLFLRPDLEKYHENLRQVDVYIHPHLKGYGAQDFTPQRIGEMIALGEEAGKAAEKDLKKLKKKLKKGK